MACFIVPTSAAVVTTAMRKKFPERLHIDWLNAMLWGGSAMLAIEHIAHGEVVPYPPFLTSGLFEVLPEMIRVGVPMTVFIVLAWLAIVVVAARLEEQAEQVEPVKA